MTPPATSHEDLNLLTENTNRAARAEHLITQLLAELEPLTPAAFNANRNVSHDSDFRHREVLRVLTAVQRQISSVHAGLRATLDADLRTR